MAGSSARRIVVEFLGDGKDLTREMDRVEGKSSRLGGVFGKLGGLGKAAAIGLGVGAAAAGVAMVGMTKNAMEDAAAQRRLALALKNTTGASDEQVAGVEDWISQQGKVLGVTDDELRPAFQRLVEATGSVSEAQRQMKIAMDVSAGTGKSLETVSAALMKANNGTTASLSKLGLKTKDAEGNTLSLKDALAAMSDTFEGQASAKANTLEGKMGRLKLMFDETKESIGAKLIPVATSLADLMLNQVGPAIGRAGAWFQNSLMPPLRDIAQDLQAKLGPAFQRIGDFVQNRVMPAFHQLGGEAPGIFARVRDVVSSVVSTVVKLWAKIGENLMPVFRQLVATFRSDVLPTLNKVIDRFQEWWPTISKVVIKVADIGTTILGVVLPPLIRLAGFILSNAVPAILDLIEIAAKLIGKAFDIGESFVHAVQGVARFLGGVKDKVGAAVSFVSGIPGKIKGALGDLGGLLLDAGKAVIQGLIDGVMSKVEDLKGVLHKVTDLIPIHKGPPGKDQILLKPAGVAIIQGLIDGIEQHKVKLQTVLDKLTSYIEKRGQRLDALLQKRQQVLDAFGNMRENLFGADLGYDASKQRQDQIASLNDGILKSQEELAKAQQELADATAEGQVDAAASAAERIKSIQDDIAKAQGQVGGLQAEDAAAPKGLAALMAFQAAQKQRATQVRDDVQTLIGKGISKDLLQQLQDQGAAGIDQIHALATGTADQIAQINADAAATQAALQQAGLAAVKDLGIQADVKAAERDIKLAQQIRDQLDDLLKQQDKNTIVQLKIGGHIIHVSLLELKRKTGQPLGLD